MSPPAPRRRNFTVAAFVTGLAAAMIGASFAAVPLYFAFCRATGFGGTTQVAQKASGERGQRVLKVRFNANVAPGLDWTFEPEQEAIEVRTGATATVFFRFRNGAERETAARAVYNVTPEVSGAWFDKVSCFCFTEQRLGPHESAELPVVFFLDPKLERDRDMDAVREITLSYTLFASPAAEKPVALAPPRPEAGAPKL
jgi:cytochrome c oxidase assembly protein subunit 11